MGKTTFWESYLTPNNDDPHLKEKISRCEYAFSDHKDNISKMLCSLQPKTVVILGSGYLNDIPLWDLVEKNRTVYLVDWIAGVSEAGMSKSIVCRDENSTNRCLFCIKGTGNQYCQNFTGTFLEAGVCSGFEAVQETFFTCKNYAPAAEPRFMQSDITAGVAHSFAVKMEKKIQFCKTAKEAFVKAIATSEQFNDTLIPVEDDTIELVTSSMVLSQFDVEPYQYFSKLLEKKFGRENILKYESILTPLMEKLRTKLFILQVESHIKEMYRMIKKDQLPRVYLSAELFRSDSNRDQFFVVKDMPKALEIIGKYFYYAFGPSLEGKTLRRVDIGGGVSINQSYMLIPKEASAL